MKMQLLEPQAKSGLRVGRSAAADPSKRGVGVPFKSPPPSLLLLYRLIDRRQLSQGVFPLSSDIFSFPPPPNFPLPPSRSSVRKCQRSRDVQETFF